MKISKKSIAEDIAVTMPTFLRHMYPFILQPNRIPPSQLLAIVTIYEMDGCRLGDLSREMHISNPTASGIVGRLELAGFVKRVDIPGDRRSKKIALTARGQQAVINFREIIRNRWTYILSKMTDREARSVIRLIKRLTEGFTSGAI